MPMLAGKIGQLGLAHGPGAVATSGGEEQGQRGHGHQAQADRRHVDAGGVDGAVDEQGGQELGDVRDGQEGGDADGRAEVGDQPGDGEQGTQCEERGRAVGQERIAQGYRVDNIRVPHQQGDNGKR